MARPDCFICDGKMSLVGLTTTNELIYWCGHCRTLFTVGFDGQRTEYPMKTHDDIVKAKKEVKTRGIGTTELHKLAA